MMLNAQPLRSVVDNRAGYLLMDSLKPDIFELNLQSHEFRAVVRQMGTQKRRVLMLDDKLRERQNIRAAALAELHSEDDQLQKLNRDRMGDLNGQRGVATADVAEEDTWLRKFEQKLVDYQNNRTQELSEEFDQLPEIRDQLHVKQEHQIKLNCQGADIRNVYQELEAAAKQVAAEGKGAAFSRYKAASQVIQQRRNELAANQQKLLDETQTAHEGELTEYLQVQLQATATHAREVSCSEQFKTLSALPAAQRLLDESQGGINEQVLVVAELQKHLNAISADVDGLSQERQARGAEYSGLQLRKNAQVESRESLKRQINAGAETLLGFLRRHHPTWTENIARLIPVETLMRTDLNPAFLEEVQQNLYGVEINLGVLPQAAVASTHALETEIASLSAQIQALSTDMEVMEKQQRGVEDRLRQAGARASATQKDLSNACLDLEILKSDHTGLIDRAREEVAQEIEIQAVRVSEAASRLEELASQQVSLKKRHRHEVSDIQAAGEGSRAQLNQEQAHHLVAAQ